MQNILQNGLKLSLQNMRSQVCNGAANILSKNSGVGKQLKREFLKALHLHFLGHCINLVVKSVNVLRVTKIDQVFTKVRNCIRTIKIRKLCRKCQKYRE